MSTWCLGRNISETVRDRDLVPKDHPRKWPIPSPIVTWPMTSRDPERSRSWPQYVWCPISRKRLEIATWWQWSAYRKWPSGNQMVTWPMTSRDPEMSRSWPQYVWCPLSRKWLETATWWQCSAYRKWAPGKRAVTWPMTSHDLKGQGHDPNMFVAHYLENGWR